MREVSPIGGLPKDLNDLVVPPLQSLTHDRAWLDSVVGRGFHGGQGPDRAADEDGAADAMEAAKQASLVKRSLDIAEAQKLLDLIDKIDNMWRETGGPSTTRMQAAQASA